MTFYFDVFTKEILTARVADKRGSRDQYIDGLEDVIGLLKGILEPVILHTDQGSVYASMAYNELIKDTISYVPFPGPESPRTTQSTKL